MRALELYIIKRRAIPMCVGKTGSLFVKTPSPRSHPLRGVGLNILLDGDPQASYLAILVLTGNQSHLSV